MTNDSTCKDYYTQNIEDEHSSHQSIPPESNFSSSEWQSFRVGSDVRVLKILKKAIRKLENIEIQW